jgi:MYXO-CTERM domain-containing protein
VYSDVYSWRSLIIDAATDASDDGGYDPPGWVTGMPADAGAPMSDAGSMDAGSMDAGSMDAGSMDAGSMDAGSMDAGSSDAGAPVDAGAMDAGGMLDDGGSGMDAGMIADAGAPTDAGLPIADSGTPMMDASTSMSDGGPPDAAARDPLGETCTSDCPSGYRCYAEKGVPPGICVPPCQAGTKCPTGYECSVELGVCTHSSPREEDDDAPSEPAGCGCRASGGSDVGDFSAAAWVLALGFATALRRRAPSRVYRRATRASSVIRPAA